MSRSLRLAQSLVWGYFHQALVVVSGLWLTRFLLKQIGEHDYGLWLLATQLLVYLSLIDFGVAALLPRDIAVVTGQGRDESEGLREIVAHTKRLVLCQVPILALISTVIWFLLPGDWTPLRGPLGLVLAVFVLAFPLRIFPTLLQGLQDLAFLGAWQTASWAVGILTTLGLVLTGHGLYSLAWGWIGQQATSSFVCWWRLSRHFPSVLAGKASYLPWSLTFARLRKCSWMSLAQVAQILLNGSELLIVGTFLGPATAVVYSCTGKLITFLTNQPRMVMQAALPGLSQVRGSESREKLFSVSATLTQGMLLISGAICCVVLLLNKGFVTWWVGAKQYGGDQVTVLLLVGMLLRHWSETLTYTLFAFGHERRITLTSILDGAVTVGGAILLVRMIGIAGVPLGSIAGACLVTIPMHLWALAGEHREAPRVLAMSLWPWFWRLSGLIALTVPVAALWVPDSLASLLLASLGALLIYGLTMLGPVTKSPLWVYIDPLWSSLKSHT